MNFTKTDKVPPLPHNRRIGVSCGLDSIWNAMPQRDHYTAIAHQRATSKGYKFTDCFVILPLNDGTIELAIASSRHLIINP